VSVLTLDLGTSTTKAALWSGDELVGLVRVPIPTRHPAPRRAEQDPRDWWRAVVEACAALQAATPDGYARVRAVGCSAARETFAGFDRQLEPVSPGILWSDTRAGDELKTLGDPARFRERTGVILSAGCAAAKVAWVRRHEPRWFEEAAWLLAPRDFVVARLTGQPHSEPTLASRTGFYTLDGSFLGDAALGRRLPPLIPSVQSMPIARPDQLGLPTGSVAILGAGDRACEAVGVGASVRAPMVSWGTTVNVSVPTPGPVATLPHRAQVSRGVGDGFLLEAGLSAAGAALEWLGSLTGSTGASLVDAAAAVAPGAGGLLAFPWLQGARAPWWQPAVYGAFIGLTSAHGPAELARALIEGVAFDTARSVEQLAPDAHALQLAGAGATEALWRSILAAVARRSVVSRRHSDAASVGARLIVGQARAEPMDLDRLNPVIAVEAPSAELVQAYQPVRRSADAVASRLLANDA
jgi:xylulokinase